jgi:hypothetical protein
MPDSSSRPMRANQEVGQEAERKPQVCMICMGKRFVGATDSREHHLSFDLALTSRAVIRTDIEI